MTRPDAQVGIGISAASAVAIELDCVMLPVTIAEKTVPIAKKTASQRQNGDNPFLM